MFFAKIPRHTRQNALTEGDLECILTRNCEGTEQLRSSIKRLQGLQTTSVRKCRGDIYCVLKHTDQEIKTFHIRVKVIVVFGCLPSHF